MATTVDNLLVNVTANTAGAVAGIGAVETRVRGLQTVSAGLGAVGGMLTKGVTLPIVAGLALSVKAFADFDSAMTQSLAIMSDDAQGFRKEMETAARAVAKTTTLSAEEAAESYFFLASAGLDAQQSIAALPQVAAFAQAGMFDMATATDLATDAQSALGLISKDASENLANLTRVTDVFVRANTLANATVEQFSEAITNKAGAALRAVGKDIEEGTAVLAVFADQGLKGAAAGTALHIVMRDLQTAALKNEDAFIAAGVAVFDADGEMRNMADITGDLTGLLDGMSDKQKKATLAQLGFTDKSIGFIQQLLGQEDAMRAYEEALRDSTGFTDSVAGKQLESFSAQWNILKSKVIDVGLSIGSVLVPKLGELIDLITPTVDKVVAWTEANSDLAVKLLGLAAAAGPALLILRGILMAVTLLSSPVLLVVAALAGLAYWLYQSGVDFDKLKEIAGVAADFVMEKWAAVQVWWAENGEAIMAVVAEIGATIMRVWEEIWAFLEPLIQDIGAFLLEVFNETVEWFKENWPAIQETVKRVMEFVQRIIEVTWPYIQSIIMGVWEAIKGIVKGALEIIKGIIQVVMGIINGDWSLAWDGIKKIVNGVWQAIRGVIHGALIIIKGLILHYIGIIRGVWDAAWSRFTDIFSSIGEGIGNALRGPIESFLGWFTDKINWVIDKINGLIGGFNKLPGPDIPKIPNLGFGGVAASGGMARVGDRGLPEMVSLPKGAVVSPLRPGDTGGGGGGTTIHLNAPQNDPIGVAKEVGWELTKRGL